MSTRKEVEEWIKNAPKCIQINSVSPELIQNKLSVVGQITPQVVTCGYNVFIECYCEKWEDE